MKVYVDGYAADGTDVLVGYKGSSEADAAAFHRPLHSLTTLWRCVDPVLLNP